MNPPGDVSRWTLAGQAAALLAIDPQLGGIVLRAGAGAVRDAWLAQFATLLPAGAPIRRAPLGVADDALFGGLDLAATLRFGRAIATSGLLAQCDGGILVLPMAERVSGACAARIAGVLDRGEVATERDGFSRLARARFSVVALDEGQGGEEYAPPALADRLAFHLDLDALSFRDIEPSAFDAAQASAARALLASVTASTEIVAALVGAAAQLGADSFRAPLLALRAARAACALRGGAEVEEQDIALAATLVLAPRARTMPAPPPREAQSEPSSEAAQGQGAGDRDSADEKPPQELIDLILAAALAAIPPGLLGRIAARASRPKSERDGKSEAKGASAKRGRPIGARAGEARQGRIGLVDTLRAAAPWQKLRRHPDEPHRIVVRPEDFRIARYRARSETTAIFVVDASGSSALQRLAEVKGAIELLLADCYVRRDSVAMIAFRGKGAEIVLPPTRSLTRARRTLAGLPGGGGTPLASGLDAAHSLADGIRRKGQSPLLVLMTDGRANVARDGGAGRARAFEEAIDAGRSLAAAGFASLAIDTAPINRAPGEPPTFRLGQAMNARYMPLPDADAARVSAAVRAAAGA